MMCRCLNVSASGYYDWRERPLSPRARENARLSERIEGLHADSEGVLGSPRIWQDLRYAGERCGKNRVASLMRQMGLQGIPQRSRWRKKPSMQRPDGIINHLERDFDADACNTKWVTDITYVRTREHWLYLCVVIDLYSGVVVGWSMSHIQDRQLVVQAVLMALWQREEHTPVILHSDRGTQGGFNRLSQHRVAESISCTRSMLRQEFSSRVFFGVWCSAYEPRLGSLEQTIEPGLYLSGNIGAEDRSYSRSCHAAMDYGGQRRRPSLQIQW